MKKNILLVLLLCLFNGPLCADGIFFARKKLVVKEPEQNAVLHFENGIETLLLKVAYQGEAREIGWVIPTPSEPKVRVIKDADKAFEALNNFTHRDVYYRRLGSRGSLRGSKPVIHQRRTIGNMEMVVLSAGSGAAVSQWLDKEQFTRTDALDQLIDHYAKKAWFFTAFKAKKSFLSKGEKENLSAVRLKFKSEEAVYPLKISSGLPGLSDIVVYLLAKSPMVLKNPEKWPRFDTAAALGEGNKRMSFSRRNNDGLKKESAGLRWPLSKNDGFFKTLEPVRLALGLESLEGLNLARYSANLSNVEMHEDLVFEPIDPKSYWSSKVNSKDDVNVYTAPLAALTVHDLETAKKTARSSDPALRALAARFHGKNLPIPRALKLAKDEDEKVREALLLGGGLTARVYERLCADEKMRWKMEHLEGPGSDRNEVLKMLNSEYLELKYFALKARTLTKEDLRKHFKSEDRKVIRSLFKNENMDLELAQEWTGGMAEEFWSSAASSVDSHKIQKWFYENGNENTRAALASRHGRNPKIMEKISRDPDEKVRAALALNCFDTPDKMKLRFANDSSPRVRIAAINCGFLDRKTIEKLVDDKDESVRDAAKKKLGLQ